MVRLSETFRERLASYSPIFWCKAKDSFERQVAWFNVLLGLDDTIALVDDEAGVVQGFAIGRLTPAPPVYAPGGPVCLIDDFCVADDAAWSTIGAGLLREIETHAKQRGAVLSVVICAHLDAKKRELLARLQFAVTSEWHVRGL